MFSKISKPGYLAVVASILCSPAVSQADTNLLFIMDSSNSMWGQIDGTTKMDIAKSALGDLVGDLPAGIQPGLMAYGHRQQGDCTDVELLAGFGQAGADVIKRQVSALTPKGKTPIAQSLKQSWNAFAGREEDKNAIVLISDGIETCGADPCAAAAELVQRGVDVTIHAVGFDVDADTKAQLQCIAAAGNGQYFDAADAGELQTAFEAAKKTVVAEAPAPQPAPEPTPEPEPSLYFEDTFDGDGLQEVWTVANADPDGYIAEMGSLLLVNGGTETLDTAAASNVVQLTGVKLPKGDWVALADVEVGLQTSRETFSLAVYDAHDSYVSADIVTTGDRYYGWSASVRIRKVSSKGVSEFSQPIASLGCNVCGADRMFDKFAATVANPMQLELVKEGRKLYARAKTAAPGAEWVITDKVSALRLKGHLTVKAGEYEDTNGETYANIDRIAITAQQ